MPKQATIVAHRRATPKVLATLTLGVGLLGLLLVGLVTNFRPMLALASPNLLINPGYETSKPNGQPLNWSIWQASGTSEVISDTQIYHGGSSSVRFRATATARTNVAQTVNVTGGEYYKYSGWVRTDNIVSTDLGSAMRLTFNDSANQTISNIFAGNWKGTNDWTYIEKVVQAPISATTVSVANFIWAATGTVWFDDVNFQVLDTIAPAIGLKAYYGNGASVNVVWDLTTTGSSPLTATIYASPQPLTEANLGTALVVGQNIPATNRQAILNYDAVANPYIGLVLRNNIGAASPLATGQATVLQYIQHLNPEHPRLIANASQFTTARNRLATDTTLQAWYAKEKQAAQALLTTPPSTYVKADGVRILEVSREVVKRIYTLGIVYQMEGGQQYIDRAWAELNAAANFPDWNPDHFLDTAEMTHAFAIGYDWFYAAWTPAQRTILRNAIFNLGLTPALKVYRGDKSGPSNRYFWLTATNNWSEVVNGGISMGALAIGDQFPLAAEEILGSAQQSLQYGLPSYKADGSSDEGIAYWNYATSYLVDYLASLETSLGSDYGISQLYGIPKTGDFPIYMANTQRSFNYGDVTTPGKSGTPAMFWLANKFNKPLYNWYQMQFGGTASFGGSAQSILWYNPAVGSSANGLSLDKFFDVNHIATFRSSWNDPNGLFAGLKAGGPTIAHSDLDLGSFILDALGVRWADELGVDDYNLPGYFDAKPNGQRWTYYRKRAEGQNTLVINPNTNPDQNPSALAPIIKFASQPTEALAVTDLTPAYASEANSVKRGIRLLDQRRQMLVQDEVQTKAPAELWWFMHTSTLAQVSPDGKSAVLMRGRNRMWAKIVDGPPEAVFTVLDAKPLPTSPNPTGQNLNSGWRKLSIHLSGVSNLRLAVLLVPLQEGENPPTSLPAIQPLANWDVVAVASPSLSNLSVNGLTVSGFDANRFSYDVVLPQGVSQVPTVTAVAGNSSDQVTITAAPSLPGTSRICVTRGSLQICYTIHFTVAPTPIAPKTYPKLSVITVTASTADGVNVAENTIDNNLATRWSGEGPGQWIRYDLGSLKVVGYVAIALFNGNLRTSDFDIQTSVDGVNWTLLYSGQSSGTSSNFENYYLENTLARYVRIVGYGNSQNTFNSYSEVGIYGFTDNTPPTVGVTVSGISLYDGAVFDEVAPLTFVMTATDAESGLSNQSLLVDDKLYASGSSLTFNGKTGLHTVKLTAVDNVGNPVEVGLNFQISNRTLLQPVRPVLECVVNKGSGNYVAYFGYKNDNTFQVNIPPGASNSFNGIANRQPITAFLPGRQYKAYSVEFNGVLVWYLYGRTSTAGGGSASCSS